MSPVHFVAIIVEVHSIAAGAWHCFGCVGCVSRHVRWLQIRGAPRTHPVPSRSRSGLISRGHSRNLHPRLDRGLGIFFPAHCSRNISTICSSVKRLLRITASLLEGHKARFATKIGPLCGGQVTPPYDRRDQHRIDFNEWRRSA